MSTAVLRFPKEVASYSSHALPPPKKPSKRKPAKSRPSPALAADKSAGWKSPNPLRHPDSPITATNIIRTNTRMSDSRDLVMEKVKILKRGEPMRPLLPPPLSTGEGMESIIPCLSDRLGPDPKVLPKPSVPAYAGPAYISSPSPSSLPVPLFLSKAASRGDDDATRSIRCLLRLDASL